ncbi:MAG: hypothetical protein ACQETL_09745 [Bacteroidota bacterium]
MITSKTIQAGKKMIRSFLFLIVYLIIAVGCSENEEEAENPNLIRDQLLYTAIDSISEGYNLNGEVIIHHEIYPDNAKISSIKNVLKSKENSDSENIELLRKLYPRLNDIIDLNIDIKKVKDYKLIIDKDSVERYNKSSDSFCVMNTSNAVLNDKENRGCFYLAIQCGDKGGNGNIVFFKKNKQDEWMIELVIRIWHG